MSDSPSTMAQMELLMSRMMSDAVKKEDRNDIKEQLTNVRGSMTKIENRVDGVEADIHNIKMEIAQIKQNTHAGGNPATD